MLLKNMWRYHRNVDVYVAGQTYVLMLQAQHLDQPLLQTTFYVQIFMRLNSSNPCSPVSSSITILTNNTSKQEKIKRKKN